jgi:protein-disulfide isomerase
MDSLASFTKVLQVAVGVTVLGFGGLSLAQTATQTAPAKAPAAKAPAATAATAQKPAPLQLQSLDPTTRPDPFPPVNPKYFTSDTPTPAAVDSYLHAMIGYDANRIWRVVAIQKTAAPGVTKVTALVSERTPNAKVQTASFFVLPDGKHLVADSTGVQPFGADPFAEARAILKARADGPSHGATSKDLMFVEFADLQCPHCKDAQAIMTKLAADFPKARIVYESFPLTEIHPLAFRAAAFGSCIAQKNSDAFFTYAQAVYDTQGALTVDDGEQTLKNATTKAGMDPDAMATCASSPAAKDMVDASTKLATDLGVDQTPTLAVNGRLLPLTTIPYETLKSLIIFQAGLDGVPVASNPFVAPKK